jgi:hypothetical protein
VSYALPSAAEYEWLGPPCMPSESLASTSTSLWEPTHVNNAPKYGEGIHALSFVPMVRFDRVFPCSILSASVSSPHCHPTSAPTTSKDQSMAYQLPDIKIICFKSSLHLPLRPRVYSGDQ